MALPKGAECEADVGLKTEPIKDDRLFVSQRPTKNYDLLRERKVLQFIVTTIIFFFERYQVLVLGEFA
jgi:hypothetical protein